MSRLHTCDLLLALDISLAVFSAQELARNAQQMLYCCHQARESVRRERRSLWQVELKVAWPSILCLALESDAATAKTTTTAPAVLIALSAPAPLRSLPNYSPPAPLPLPPQWILPASSIPAAAVASLTPDWGKTRHFSLQNDVFRIPSSQMPSATQMKEREKNHYDPHSVLSACLSVSLSVLLL